MLKRVLILTLLFAVAAVSIAGDVKAEVKAVYAKWAAATEALDLDGLLALLHPSFRQVDVNGNVMGYKDMRKMMESYVGIMKDCKVSFDFARIDGYADEASVWVAFTASFKVKQNGKWVHQKFTAKQYETLKKTPKGWMFTMSQDLPG